MLMLGPFLVARDGRLSLRAPHLRPLIRYAWRGRRCLAELSADRLRLLALAGRIPSTAEAAADRARAVGAVLALRAELAGLDLGLLPDHRVVLRATAPPPEGAIELLAAMTRFALRLDAPLEQLAAAGIT
ncbi:MAG: hypothetical protein RMK64_08555 [Rhodovarius sp.]|nr:hypothetical protein [Rhodovarius sp.]MCX7932024.1 hypothetical protein [Rhodovarius sp.]MDW8315004.1 hypothetical protein [Rhodovarius sp.]